MAPTHLESTGNSDAMLEYVHLCIFPTHLEDIQYFQERITLCITYRGFYDVESPLVEVE